MIVQRLLLFIGEEKKAGVGRDLAQRDIMMKLQGGLPPLFYRDIPYMPVYVAAGDHIQFGFVLANGKVRDLRRSPSCDLHAQVLCSPVLTWYLLIHLLNVSRLLWP